jgi:16S rRNA processing protein RimM
MTWNEMAVVGQIARPHGLRGQVIVNLETDFPEQRFYPGADLFVNRPEGIERLTLTTVRFQQGRPIVGLERVDTVEAAQPLAGLELRVPAERLVRLPAGSFYRHDLVGCRVETRGGRAIGTVTGVEGTIEAGRLVVSSEGEEILIPLASAICTAIDAVGKRIVIEPPEGLLELNR